MAILGSVPPHQGLWAIGTRWSIPPRVREIVLQRRTGRDEWTSMWHELPLTFQATDATHDTVWRQLAPESVAVSIRGVLGPGRRFVVSP
jgi:hypothetical protein